MPFDVKFRPAALDDLAAIANWLTNVADPDISRDYVRRLRERCLELAAFPERGTPHPDRGAGLRSIPFRRSATIHYRLDGSSVQIVRILRAGRDPDRELILRKDA